ncbi:MAG: hypothetical protein O7D94_05680, partial [Planctomycetota bacterium]|nr:hypothetical protein [Planctomycetota bacterium]
MYASPKAKRLKSALTRGIAAGLWTVILSPFAIASLTTDYEHIVWGTLLLAIAVSSLAVLVSVWRDRADVWASEGRCRTCGYNLRGNESGVCPECSTPVPKHEAGATFRNPLGFRRIAKWVCLVVCLLILIVWHHSLDTYVTWTSPEKKYQYILTWGRIELIGVVPCGQLEFADHLSPGFQSVNGLYGEGRSFGLFNPFVNRTMDYSALWLPLWT